jgi:uncharacterized protein HemY
MDARAQLTIAKKALETGDLTAAVMTAHKAMSRDKSSPTAELLLEEIAAQLEQHEREHQMSNAVARCERLISIGAYDEASSLIETLNPQPEVQRLRSSLQEARSAAERRLAAQQRIEDAKRAMREMLARTLGSGTRACDKHELEDAVKCLRSALTEVDVDDESIQLLEYAESQLE